MTIKIVIFDLDGVLYKGDVSVKPIPGAIETLSELRKDGKKVFFLTNAGTLSRAGRAQKLRKLGFEVEDSEVYTSSYGAGVYISKQKRNPSAYCLGEGGLKEQLSEFGIYLTDKDPDFVVVSLDRGLTYPRLSTAFNNILKGSTFIATNLDSSYPTNRGLLPGAGSIVKAVEYATGKKPHIIGKPTTYLLEMIFKNCNCAKEEILMVGDRLDSDIELAKRAGIKSALVLSGISSREDVEKLKKEEKPDYLAGSVKDLIPILNSHQ